MLIVDAQHHEITPRLAWDVDAVEVRYQLLTEIMLAWMDAVGVDAALVNPLDDGFGRAAVAYEPDRFATFIAVLRPEAIDIESTVRELSEQAGVVAVRTSFGNSREDPRGERAVARFRAGAFDGLFAACSEYRMPLFCSAYGHAGLVGEAALRYPDLMLVVDHMGIPQPPVLRPDSPPWRALDELATMSDHANIFVKVTAAPVLSTESYPYPDVWPHLHRLTAAFGAERLMWASDIGRLHGRIGWETMFPEGFGPYPGKHTYAQSLFLLLETDQLSDVEKEQIIGGTVRRLVDWPSIS